MSLESHNTILNGNIDYSINKLEENLKKITLYHRENIGNVNNLSYILVYLDNITEKLEKQQQEFNEKQIINLKNLDEKINDNFYHLTDLVIKRCDIIESNLMSKMTDIIVSINKVSTDNFKAINKQMFKMNERYEKLTKIEEIEKNINDISNKLNITLSEYLQDSQAQKNGNKPMGCLFS